MRNSMARASVRTPANPVHRDLDQLRAGKANLRIDANSADIAPKSRREAAGVVRNAMHAANLSQKAFAVDANQSESVISEGLSGGRALAFDWVYSQTDVAFHVELLAGMAREKGITPESKRQIKMRLVMTLMAQFLDLVEEA